MRAQGGSIFDFEGFVQIRTVSHPMRATNADRVGKNRRILTNIARYNSKTV